MRRPIIKRIYSTQAIQSHPIPRIVATCADFKLIYIYVKKDYAIYKQRNCDCGYEII